METVTMAGPFIHVIVQSGFKPKCLKMWRLDQEFGMCSSSQKTDKCDVGCYHYM